MNQGHFVRSSLLALLFAIIFAGHASAQLYWSGAGLNPVTAGSGTWDTANSQWSSTFPGYTAANWNSSMANFHGTGGGTVTISVAEFTNIIVNDINFGANAGAFTLLNSGANGGLLVNGPGITNNSANTQAIINSGSSSILRFTSGATAANAAITNSGDNSHTLFVNASAANATNNNSATGSDTQFAGAAATAANANITNSGRSSETQFSNGGTSAANATIINSGEDSVTTFHNGATAANATITNSNSDDLSSFTIFFDTATAGNANIANIGNDSGTQFIGSATAASSTITNSGNNSLTEFFQISSGGSASLVNANPTAFIDISGLGTGGTTAGSIAGNGFLRLGSKDLTAGGNNTSTTFSGVIQDEGLSEETGGSLTKVGIGTLILSGANTYTGGTEIALGRILVSNSTGSGTGSGPVAVDNGAILGGTGTIQLGGGATLTNNGTMAPGASAGQFNIGGNTQLNYPSTLSFEIGGTTPATQYDVLNKSDAGALTLNGKLIVALINGFTPQASDSFTIVNTQAVLGGTFTNVKSGTRLNTSDGAGSFTVTYSGSSNVVLSNYGSPLAASQAQNISTRANVQTGDNVAIGGFIIGGTGDKRVLIRGLGPSLQNAGIPNPLPNPTLELHTPQSGVITNDDWKETQQTEIQDTGLAPGNDLDSAILATLQPGTYTAILAGQNNSTGIALVEIYDLDPAANAKLANISTRGLVGTSDDVMIGGIIVGPNNTNGARVLVRALGPALQSGGIPNFLADPVLELHDPNGNLFALNNNWKDVQQTDLAATGLAPSNDTEPAVVATLAPGVWTAIVTGAGATTGVALVEAYYLP
jgi:autotransporter-associated beta strand protein